MTAAGSLSSIYYADEILQAYVFFEPKPGVCRLTSHASLCLSFRRLNNRLIIRCYNYPC